jgi:KDO2-lipid IV(A) lauroyltransferase
MLVYYFCRLSGAVAPKLPPAIGYWICRVIGGMLYQFCPLARARILLNMERAMGPEVAPAEIKRRARACFNYVLYNYFDLFRLPTLSAAALKRRVTFKGWEHVEAALAQGRGLILTTAHFGNLETPVYAMAARGLAITVPVERMQPPQLFAYLSALRMSHSRLKLLPVDSPLLGLWRALKRGEVVALTGDRDITGSGRMVNFLGSPASLPDGQVRLALRSGAPLLFYFSRRQPDHTYLVEFRPPCSLPTEGDEAARIAAGLSLVVNEMEEAIRQTPEQWLLTVSLWADQER